MDYEKYHIKQVLNLDDDLDDDSNDRIKNAYWYPNLNVLNMLVNYCLSHSFQQVLEIGPGQTPFPLSNTFVGLDEKQPGYISVDMNHQVIPFENGHFDFLYARHFLEDVECPHFAVLEMIRCCKSGYIETPSPMIEIMRGVDAAENNHLYRGYSHHHSIIWGDMENNTLHILPKKKDLLEAIVVKRKYVHLANHHPVYWNQYFLWESKPQVIVYTEDDCRDQDKYLSLINTAIFSSMKNTRFFLEKLHLFQEPKTVHVVAAV